MYELTLSCTFRRRLSRLCSFGSLYADSLYQYYFLCLSLLLFNFPDGTHFDRVKRYASGNCIVIEYRAYDALRIELTFNILNVL